MVVACGLGSLGEVLALLEPGAPEVDVNTRVGTGEIRLWLQRPGMVT